MTFKKAAVPVFIFFILFISFSISCAAITIPEIIGYEGRLTNASDDSPVTSATTFTFKIWDKSAPPNNPGNPLTTEVQVITPDSNGVFSTVINIPDTVFTGADRWLGVTVSPDTTEMAPRIRIASAPYAYLALNGGNSLWTAGSGNNIYRLNGNVGIGTTAPAHGSLEITTSIEAAHWPGYDQYMVVPAGVAVYAPSSQQVAVYAEGSTGVYGVGTPGGWFEGGVNIRSGNLGVGGLVTISGGSPANGFVLTSTNSSGTATWEPASGGSGLWSTSTGTNIYKTDYTSGSVGVGTSEPGWYGKLEVITSESGDDIHAHQYYNSIYAKNPAGTAVYAEGSTGVYGVGTVWAGYFNGNGLFSGNVGVGVPLGSGPRSTLEVDGNVTMGGWHDPRQGIDSVAMGIGHLTGGTASVAMGNYNTAAGSYSVAMGEGTTSEGTASVAMGASTTAIGTASVAMGNSSVAVGNYSVAMGQTTIAAGDYSVAMGGSTSTEASYATAMGESTIASGRGSAAMGGGTSSGGIYSTAMGLDTFADTYASLVIGRFNVQGLGVGTTWQAADPVFVIGKGTSTMAESNAVTVLKNGNVGIGTTAPKSVLHVVGLPTYVNNAAALAGGLTAGAFYRTGADPDVVCVVH